MACSLPIFAHYASILDRTNRKSAAAQAVCSPTKRERRPSSFESPPLLNQWQAVNQLNVSWSPLKQAGSPIAKEQKDPATGEPLPFSPLQAAERRPLSPAPPMERLPLGSLMTVERLPCSPSPIIERRLCSPSPTARDRDGVDARERSHAWRSNSADRLRRQASVERCWPDARERSPYVGQSPVAGGRGRRSHVASSGAATVRDPSPCEVKSYWERSLRSSPSHCPASPCKAPASSGPATAFVPCWFNVAVPDSFSPGGQIAFAGLDGRWWAAWVPAGAHPGQRFNVHLRGDEALQPFNVIVPRDKKSGDRIPYVGLDGKSYSVIVPEGVSEGQSFAAWQKLVSVPAREQLDAEELRPWMEAARNFEMNRDFHVDLPQGELDFNTLMGKMKQASEGKTTIQALGDKILLSRMLANLGVPQMPILLEVQTGAAIQQLVERFVEERSTCEDPCKLFVKPSHLSNANGVMCLGATGSSEGGTSSGYKPIGNDEKTREIKRLTAHMTKYMGERAANNESLALQSLKPGFLVQPQYESVIGFQWPLELRVLTIWGKARMGIWWWGYRGQPDVKSNRNTWFVRIPATRGKLLDDDRWDTVHSHVGVNPGFESAIKLLGRHMPSMAAMAEYVATMVGAPFLRVDFFVGSPRWGVRLNEVAYGSTIEFCRRSTHGKSGLVNDAGCIAEIIQRGMAVCKTQLPALSFLGRLGCMGQRYEDMSVSCCPSLPRFRAQADPECVDFAVTSDLCRTHHSVEPGLTRRDCKCGLESLLDSFQATDGAQHDVLSAISCLSTHGFLKLQQHHLQPGSKLYLWVKSYFLEAMEARQVSIEEAPRQVAVEHYPLFAIQRIVFINNPQLLRLYRAQQLLYQTYKCRPMVGVRARTPKRPHDGNEFFLWHACSDAAASNICQQGFESQPGRHVRFAESAISADVRAKQNASGVRCQVLARVLVGKAKRISRKRSAVASVTAGCGDDFIINHQYEALPLFRVYYKHARTCACNCCRKGC
eukprot:TRINITY_DN13753_c0_g1_i1.p1 TRINITY_DN13753_c0_g1~~TRINITY_DN13753_c0_g1_i1.p1  ORF type:complete len:1005 (+),score=127.51 TRINITY_DN13753_c0_g1_i1:23-3016(+)